MALYVCPSCRTALPANARFCNGCGIPLPARSAVERTAQYTAGSYPAAPPAAAAAGPQWQAPAVAAEVTTSARRPVALLALLVLLLLGGAGTGAALLLRNRGNLVVAGAAPGEPPGPGVVQAVSPQIPASPGVVAAQPGTPPPPGSPVTAGSRRPDGMAPSVVMAPGTRVPSSPSVTQAPTVETPETAPLTAQTPAPTQPVAPVIGAPSPAPAAPPDNADFDRYIRWLQYVDNERHALRAQGETWIFQMLPRMLTADLADILGDENVIDEQAALARRQQQQRAEVSRILAAMQVFRNNILRTKPPVPPDCRALDTYYMAAMDEEVRQTARALDAFGRSDIGSLRQILSAGGGVSRIDTNLGMANRELERAFRGRGLNPIFSIPTGSNSSLLGGLVGSLGPR
jgi:hypothetical protein